MKSIKVLSYRGTFRFFMIPLILDAPQIFTDVDM